MQYYYNRLNKYSLVLHQIIVRFEYWLFVHYGWICCWLSFHLQDLLILQLCFRLVSIYLQFLIIFIFIWSCLLLNFEILPSLNFSLCFTCLAWRNILIDFVYLKLLIHFYSDCPLNFPCFKMSILIIVFGFFVNHFDCIFFLIH